MAEDQGESGAGIFAVATAIAQAPNRCRNFPIDTTPREAEHPVLHPGSGVYFLLTAQHTMLTIGETDVFERDYMQRFRAFAGQFGEFVSYERDRGARDIGLHLTHKLASGKERLSTALCWFQMKGIMASTLPKKAFDKASVVKLSLDVVHLQYWFLQPTPTYLVVYVQSAETFLVTNIQELVEKKWGKSILSLQQKTATVEVPTTSLLDEQAFRIILTRSDIEEWTKALDTDKESARVCRRDYDLIWHFGTAKQRKVLHRVVFWDWQSKTRSQFYIQERGQSESSKWDLISPEAQQATAKSRAGMRSGGHAVFVALGDAPLVTKTLLGNKMQTYPAEFRG